MIQRHFFSTLHPLSMVIFATATALAFVLLRDSRFNFHFYTQREETPTQKLARKCAATSRDILRERLQSAFTLANQLHWITQSKNASSHLIYFISYLILSNLIIFSFDVLGCVVWCTWVLTYVFSLLQWIVTKIQEQMTKLKNWTDSNTNSIVAVFLLEWNVSVSCLDLLKSYFAVPVLVQILSVVFSIVVFSPILPSSVLNKCDVPTDVLWLM